MYVEQQPATLLKLLCLYQALKYHESAIPDYSPLHGVDPGDLLTEEFMSDYLSGPEDEDIKSVKGWKLRMARENRIDGEKMGPSGCIPSGNLTKWVQQIQSWRIRENTNYFHIVFINHFSAQQPVVGISSSTQAQMFHHHKNLHYGSLFIREIKQLLRRA